MRIKKPYSILTLWVLLLVPLWLLTTGSKCFSKSPIPPPFAEDITFGEVIKEIRLVGNEIVKDDVIFTAMKSKPGEIYTEESATIDYKWLSQFGTFTTIHFTTSSVARWGSKASIFFTVGGATNFGLKFADPWIPGRSWFAGYRLDFVHSERRNDSTSLMKRPTISSSK